MRWIATLLCVGGATTTSAEAPLGGFPPDDETVVSRRVDENAVPLFVHVYPVADLVVQPDRMSGGGAVMIEASPLPSFAPSEVVSCEQIARESLAELSVILQSVIAPESWELSGGPAQLALHEGTFTLIVRQSAEAHEEIAELLSELRAAASVEVLLTIEEFTSAAAPADELDAPKNGRKQHAAANELVPRCREPVDGDQVEALRAALAGRFVEMHQHNLLLRNGKTDSTAGVRCTAVVSNDRRSVWLDLQWAGVTPEAPQHTIRCRLQDGHSQVVLLPYKNGATRLAVVTAGIHTAGELEERLDSDLLHPLPITGHSSAAGDSPIAPISLEADGEAEAAETAAANPLPTAAKPRESTAPPLEK